MNIEFKQGISGKQDGIINIYTLSTKSHSNEKSFSFPFSVTFLPSIQFSKSYIIIIIIFSELDFGIIELGSVMTDKISFKNTTDLKLEWFIKIEEIESNSISFFFFSLEYKSYYFLILLFLPQR